MMTEPSDGAIVPELVAGAFDLLPGGGLLGVFGERGAKLVLQEWQRNRSRTLRLAEELAGLSREELAQVIADNPRIVPLLIRTLHAAGMTGQDKTLKLLAGFLGDALADVSKIDDVETLVGALSNLTEHHIKVLELVASEPSKHAVSAEAASEHWTSGLVIAISSMRPELTLVGIQGLLAAGFISDAGLDGGGATWSDVQSGGTILQITELGRTVIRMLNNIAASDLT